MGHIEFPLAPYRVLDLATGGAMLAGQVLADLGADVTAIEPPGGSPSRRLPPFANVDGSKVSLFWEAYARGKRVLTIDLEGERERFLALAANADVVIESFPPGYLSGLGLGYQDLARANERLVMVSVTPFGSDGPKAAWRATDLTVLAASGTLLLTGDADRPPVQVPGEQAMLHAGAEAAAAALIALAARERDGLGQHVDVSAQEVMTIATQAFVLKAAWNDPVSVVRSGGGTKVAGHHIRYVYECKDGHVAVTFLFGNIIGPFTRRLFEWMHAEGAIDEATRDKDWVGYFLHLLDGSEPASELSRCTAAIEAFTRRRTKAELAAAALERGLLIVPVNTVEDVLASRQLEARGFWRDYAIGRGTVRAPGPFARFSGASVGQYDRRFMEGSTRTEPGPAASRRSMDASVRRPALEGLNVLDLSWVYATPAGVRTLADYGATVVHVESPTRPDTLRSAQPYRDGVPGGERSAQYATIQANKYGLSANLGTAGGKELVRRLAVEWADVLVESFSPGTMARLGLGYEDLHAANPRLIMLSSCLNGQDGPDAGLAGFGTMGGHLAGFGHLTGWPDRAPAGPFTAYTDYTTPKFVTSAILAALDQRRRTGEGQYIDLAQIEVAQHYLATALLAAQLGDSPRRQGNQSTVMGPHGVYPCAGEERWIAISCPSDDEWHALRGVLEAEWCGDPRFASAEGRIAHANLLDDRIGAWTREHSVELLEARLQEAGVPAHRCSTSEDLLHDPQFAHRGHWAEVPHPELGSVVVEGPRSRMSGTAPGMWGSGPTFGEHNELVLREFLGLDERAMAHFVEQGVLS